MSFKGIQKKNIYLGLFFKGLGVGLNFLIIPALIFFLGKSQYGVWVTVFSVVNWIFTFDIGVGQGLRNKLTEAFASHDYGKAGSLITSAYLLLALFALLILIFGTLLIFLLDIQAILNYEQANNAYLRTFLFLALVFTTINFVLSLYKKLFLAIHKSYALELINSVFLFSFLMGVVIWNQTNWNKDLVGLICLFGVFNIIIALISTGIFFYLNKKVGFTFRNFNKELAYSLLGLGKEFFVINVSLLIILSTDNVIISKMLSPSDVTDYSVVQRIYQMLIIAFNVVLAASWGLYSEALVKGNYEWIRSNIYLMLRYLMVVIIVGIAFLFAMENILDLWLGEGLIKLPSGLVFLNLFYAIMYCFTSIYTHFINATGKITLQMYLFIIAAVLNIPLSIVFVNYLGTSTGVMIATVLCVTPLSIAMPLQTKYILKKMDSNRF